LLRAVFFFLCSDTIQSYTASTPHGSYRGLENGKIPVGYFGLPWYRKFTLTWLQIILTYQLLSLYYELCAIISVVFGLSTPRECPPMFGDLRNMYTLRQSWSMVWHQQCRRICSTFSILLARDALRLRKGGFASKYFQLFVGFFVSAIVHGVGVMLTHKSLDDDAAFVCFMAQAVGIMAEDHIIQFGKSIGLRNSPFWRLVGYIWVVSWFGFSLLPHISASLDSGMWIHNKEVDLFGLGPKH